MKLLPSRLSSAPARRAFTIIEIALCLGIIGFALVAIIAALPRGLDVQKRNREETIIDQNAEVWMSALRNGAQGYDDLTNYVLVISNLWTDYNGQFQVIKTGVDYYTPTSSVVSSPYIVPAPPNNQFLLTNGARIVGLLSMPKLMNDTNTPTTPHQFTPLPNYSLPPYQSNYVIAYVRAFGGSAASQAPQTNTSILSDAFTYRMIVENFPYAAVDTNAFCLDCPATNGLSVADMAARTNLVRTMWMLQANSHDFRLRFRWPVLPNGEIPNYGFLTFRSMADGILFETNDPSDAAIAGQPLFFVQSSGYTNISALP